jgi:mannose-6-phosphate isomerase-like protein (cupin superfamily)
MMTPAVYLSRAAELPAFRISPNDTNYFVLLHDDTVPGFQHVAVVEIFERGGKTPPNSHVAAFEFFYVLGGSGRATCDGETVDIARGMSMLVPPKSVHVIENTGPGKLYTLTLMLPDEAFAAAIKQGTPATLDAEDIAFLTGQN